jgi:hypothetical protein
MVYFCPKFKIDYNNHEKNLPDHLSDYVYCVPGTDCEYS